MWRARPIQDSTPQGPTAPRLKVETRNTTPCRARRAADVDPKSLSPGRLAVNSSLVTTHKGWLANHHLFLVSAVMTDGSCHSIGADSRRSTGLGSGLPHAVLPSLWHVCCLRGTSNQQRHARGEASRFSGLWIVNIFFFSLHPRCDIRSEVYV